MLKNILSISGKPGLYKLISQGKNMFIAESLIDQKRIPVYARDKVVSLGDIAIYTEDEDVALAKVLEAVKAAEAGKEKENVSAMTTDGLKTYFATILPDYDRERVYPSDIKKLINWYNLLIRSGFETFESTETEAVAADEPKAADNE